MTVKFYDRTTNLSHFWSKTNCLNSFTMARSCRCDHCRASSCVMSLVASRILAGVHAFTLSREAKSCRFSSKTSVSVFWRLEALVGCALVVSRFLVGRFSTSFCFVWIKQCKQGLSDNASHMHLELGPQNARSVFNPDVVFLESSAIKRKWEWKYVRSKYLRLHNILNLESQLHCNLINILLLQACH